MGVLRWWCCRLVGRLVALAASLEGYRLPYHLHPFLRHFAARSSLLM